SLQGKNDVAMEISTWIITTMLVSRYLVGNFADGFVSMWAKNIVKTRFLIPEFFTFFRQSQDKIYNPFCYVYLRINNIFKPKFSNVSVYLLYTFYTIQILDKCFIHVLLLIR